MFPNHLIALTPSVVFLSFFYELFAVVVVVFSFTQFSFALKWDKEMRYTSCWPRFALIVYHWAGSFPERVNRLELAFGTRAIRTIEKSPGSRTVPVCVCLSASVTGDLPTMSATSFLMKWKRSTQTLFKKCTNQRESFTTSQPKLHFNNNNSFRTLYRCLSLFDSFSLFPC